jgi:hypothetical protein
MKLHNDAIHNLYSSSNKSNNSKETILRGIGNMEHVSHTGLRNTNWYILFGNRKGKIPLGRPRSG